MFAIRRIGYWVIDRLSEVKQVRNSTGFGLYDQAFVSVLAAAAGSISVFQGNRGGARVSLRDDFRIPSRAHQGHHQEQRYPLYDIGVQGIVNHSKIPLRLATMLGFFSSVISLCARPSSTS